MASERSEYLSLRSLAATRRIPAAAAHIRG
jgi:hypothetical protein